MRSKRFSDLSPTGRRLVSVVTVVSLVLIVAAERDIQRRPAERLRGPKALWRVLSLNGLGALAYFGLGRRSAVD